MCYVKIAVIPNAVEKNASFFRKIFKENVGKAYWNIRKVWKEYRNEL